MFGVTACDALIPILGYVNEKLLFSASKHLFSDSRTYSTLNEDRDRASLMLQSE